MIHIKRYTSQYKTEWNLFNERAINGSFLFNRDFMEYHSDRFIDHSLLFYHKNKIIALLPLHEKQETAVSHGGITFGGLVLTDKMHTELLLQLFDQLYGYLQTHSFKNFLYKPQPIIYYLKPAQDDLMALYHLQAKLHSRTIISVLDLTSNITYSKLRKRCLKKAIQYDLVVEQSGDIAAYMPLVQKIYEAANLKPTHTTEELQYLMSSFPDHIKLWVAYTGRELVGGVVIFEHSQVVNLQYIATTELGKKMHALDLLVNNLIIKYQGHKKYLNFGTSEDTGPYGLNLKLLQNKASYGTHAVVQDTYMIHLN